MSSKSDTGSRTVARAMRRPYRVADEPSGSHRAVAGSEVLAVIAMPPERRHDRQMATPCCRASGPRLGPRRKPRSVFRLSDMTGRAWSEPARTLPSDHATDPGTARRLSAGERTPLCRTVPLFGPVPYHTGLGRSGASDNDFLYGSANPARIPASATAVLSRNGTLASPDDPQRRQAGEGNSPTGPTADIRFPLARS